MADEIKKMKIKELPLTTSIGDNDIFVESDTLETYKVTARDLAGYISENAHMTERYIPKNSSGAANGVAPLNAAAKIDGRFLSYGTAANTAYEGRDGKRLEQNIDSHLTDENAHRYQTKINELQEVLDTNIPIWNAAKAHADSAHAPAGAEANQNAFSNVAVGSSIIAADSKTDTLTLAAGSNITLTPDPSDDKITIAAKDTVYTHPSGDGNKHVPANGTLNGGKYLKAAASAGVYEWGRLLKSDVTAALGYTPGTSSTDTNTTYTLSKSGSTITLTGSDGSRTSVTDSDTNTDTKNTAGSTNSTSKLYLIGALSQASYPQTYSRSCAYIGTDGCLYSNGARVVSEFTGTSEPTSQKTGDYWLLDY